MAAPLFLLAPPRSYTSLVNAMIGQHPQAFGLPELCLFNVERLIDLWNGVEGENAERGAMARHGLMRAVAEIYCGEQSTATINMARAWASVREHWETGRVFRELVDKLDPLVAVEKSPSYTVAVPRMKALYRTFPEARFIHLVRHPIPQGKSVMAINNGAFTMRMGAFEIHEDFANLEPQIAWHDVNLNILEFLEGVPAGQQICVRGEDIMADPHAKLAEIARWLGLSDDDDAIEEMMHPERSPFACFGPLAAMFGNDPNFLSGPTFRPHTPKIPKLDSPLPWRSDGKGLYPEVISLAREFGYEH
ncbi:MAG TPA: sulfotransferase [Rhodanobacteraceae bacterium]